MSNDKSNATYHGRGELPRRGPGETLASWDRSHMTQPFGTGERPYVSPGKPPWDGQVHQDLAVQHGWPTPGEPHKRPVVALIVLAVVLGLLLASVLVGIAVSLVETPPPRPVNPSCPGSQNAMCRY